jgi:lipopolysaccharide transport system ATP-binding protein
MREVGKTVVFVSHDLASVRRFCDRVLLLVHGTLRSVGPADDVVDEYLHEFAHEPV